MVNGVGVSSGFASAFRCSCFSISGRPEDRTQRGSVISRTWATSPRRPLLSRAPRGRTENLLVPNQACSQLHLCPMLLFVQSERSDLNRRSPVPRTGAITRLRYVLMMSAARMGIVVCAYLSRSGPGGARILVSCSSGRRYTVSATSPFFGVGFCVPCDGARKKPDVAVTPGFA